MNHLQMATIVPGHLNTPEPSASMLVYTPFLRDGTIKFCKIQYPVGKELIGHRVEILVSLDQLRAFLDSNKLLIFKLGKSDAVMVKMDRYF